MLGVPENFRWKPGAENIPLDLIRLVPAEESMKKSVLFSTFILTLSSLFMVSGCNKKLDIDPARAKEVVVYTYDSFCGEWGSGPEIAKLFEEKTGIKVTYVDCGGAMEVLSKAILEKNNPEADLLIGFDNNMTAKVVEADILQEYKPSDADAVLAEGLSSELNAGGKWLMTPYDYSHFALIYNTKSSVPAPESLEDLTKPEYAKQVVIMDDRTSSVGLGFKTWVDKVYGDKAADYMARLEPSLLTVAPGWSAGYGMFTSGEVPLVTSYVSSPAANILYDGITDYEALIFDEGHVRQIEGAGIVKNAKNVSGAKLFMDFLITEAAQNVIPETQWMFPANKNVKLPECYDGTVIPSKTL